MSGLIARHRWSILAAGAVGFLAFSLWLFTAEHPAVQFLFRLYRDKQFLKHTLAEWGVLAPVIFILIQALQVVVSPIPGEATGFLGGYLFGQWLGLLYSTIGLTLGSLTAFGIGRWVGATFVRGLVTHDTWGRLGFIVEAEGAILCFVIYLVPGLPKDVVCYLFGMSPMPFWVFAVLSTLGRVPGTWMLSIQGDATAAGHWILLIAVSAAGLAIALPLYYYRQRIVAWCRDRQARDEAP